MKINMKVIGIVAAVMLAAWLVIPSNSKPYQIYGAEGDAACEVMAAGALQMVGSIYEQLTPSDAGNAMTGAKADAVLLGELTPAQGDALGITIAQLRLAAQGKESLTIKNIYMRCSELIGTRAKPQK